MKARARVLASLVAGMALSGCYYYESVAVSSLTPPSEVRLVLESEWIPGQPIGAAAGENVLVRGRFVREQANSIVLRPDLHELGLFSYAFNDGEEPIQIPERRIIRVEQKRFDRRNTLLMSSGVGALVGFFLWNRLGGETGRIGRGPSDLPTDAALLEPF